MGQSSYDTTSRIMNSINALACLAMVVIANALPQAIPPSRPVPGASPFPIVGAEKCSRGPGYWCQNLDTVIECDAFEHCKKERQQQQQLPVLPLTGSDLCSRGPGHWCQSPANAVGCGQGAFTFCMEQTEKSVGQSPPVLGADPCTFGPSAVCQSFESMRKCGLTMEVCAPHFGIQQSAVKSSPILGADPCTFAPSAICQSFESMRKCGLSLEVCKPHLGSGVGSLLGLSLGSAPIVA